MPSVARCRQLTSWKPLTATWKESAAKWTLLSIRRHDFFHSTPQDLIPNQSPETHRMTGNVSAKNGESTYKSLKEYYANLRVAAAPTHAGFTAGLRWIEGNIRRGRSRGVLLHCHANVQTVGSTRRQTQTVQNFVLRRVNESRSAASLAARAFQHIQGPHAFHEFCPRVISPGTGFWRSAAGVG